MELTGLTTEQIRNEVQQLGMPAFRGQQIADWLYKKSVRSFDEMTNLSAAVRQQLAEHFQFPPLSIVTADRSEDGTTKYLVELRDGNRVECVYLPYKDRKTICISTQVGCAMNCSFCATGIGGLIRDLSAGEIVDQILLVQADQKERISNVVYMGMGEPLANYPETVKSIRLLSSEVGISVRHITVSTVGIAPAIRYLADEGLPITLAVSIHAPSDLVRGLIMPVSDLHAMEDLLSACRYWVEKTNRKMTFEYLLLKGVNDSPVHAKDLAARIRKLHANVNIIPYNHVEGRGDYRRPTRETIDSFKNELAANGINVTERMRKGNPINAACGQLRHESERGRRIPQKN